MRDVIVLVWVGFIFFAAVFFACISIFHLFKNKKIRFDEGFLLSLSACLLAVVLCLSVWPPLYHVYQDEFAYTSQSINIVSFGKAGITLKGSLIQPEAFSSWVANPKLPGFAWLEAVILFFTKDFKHSFFYLNIFLGTLSVAAVYRITWLWTASSTVAWWSAIFWACLPVRITYSMSAASDIAGAFFFFLFLLFLSEYRTLKAKRILYAALFCGVYSICIKPFYGVSFILGLAVTLYVYQREGLLDRKLSSQIWVDTVCLFLPILSATPVFLFSDSMAGGYSFSFMLKNICTSISYLFNYEQITVLTSLAALTAVGRSIFYKKDNLVIRLAGWFLVGLLTMSVFYAGGFSSQSNAYSDRYFLFLALPFVLLAAKGADDVARMVRARLLMLLLFIVLVVNASFASYQLVSITKHLDFYKKALLLKKIVYLIPDKAYLIDECAAFVVLNASIKSIQTTLFLNGDHPKEIVVLNGVCDFTDTHAAIALFENILNTEYRCKPLVAAPFKEAYLSATPFLCIRK